MASSTVSSKYQVTIPQVIREQLGVKPGQRFEVFAYDHRIELVPIRPLKELRGFLKGMDTTFERDDDRV